MILFLSMCMYGCVSVWRGFVFINVGAHRGLGSPWAVVTDPVIWVQVPLQESYVLITTEQSLQLAN